MVGLISCIGPFKRTSRLAPLNLQIDVEAETAKAYLTWRRAVRQDFLYYEVQRASNRALDPNFTTLARIEASYDTTLVDVGLQGDTRYRYKILSHYGKKDKIRHTLSSLSVAGGLHHFVEAWDLPAGFLPTRLVAMLDGVICVVGAGSGEVARFSLDGKALESWVFSTAAPSCLETATLDGPGLALDSQQNLYVVYNIQEEDKPPQGYWTKFAADGSHQWERPLEGLFVRHIAISPADQIFIESISQLHQFNAIGERQDQFHVPPLLVSSLGFWRDHFAALVEPLSVSAVGWQSPRLLIYDEANRTDVHLEIGRDPSSPEDRGSGLLQRPSDFVFESSGERVFVVNAGAGRIEVFRQGKFLTRWGLEGQEAGAFRLSGEATVVDNIRTGSTVQRQCIAGGITYGPQGYIYVADTFNNRIQKFQP